MQRERAGVSAVVFGFPFCFVVMKILPFVSAVVPVAGLSSAKVTRLSCCCKISELLPLVRQLHEEARAMQAMLAQAEVLRQAA